jgi:hypothetical protein
MPPVAAIAAPAALALMKSRRLLVIIYSPSMKLELV